LIANEAGNDQFKANYLNPAPEEAVRARFGMPMHSPSLAIPTWRYGHEPSNRFATYYAKYFSNAIREDALIDVALGGILYFPGSAGTRQEIFQTACFNHYAEANDVTPMVFVDSKFWTNPPVFQLFQRLAQGRPFSKWLLLSDEIDDICDHFLKHAKERKLPLVKDFEKLNKEHWTK
jgi:predicted Rossmann-fold nucleotide-binding protein